eukprot:scaffold323_cov414-Prasinococcus_capsulatus_cf.AAC.6
MEYGSESSLSISSITMGRSRSSLYWRYSMGGSGAADAPLAVLMATAAHQGPPELVAACSPARTVLAADRLRAGPCRAALL